VLSAEHGRDPSSIFRDLQAPNETIETIPNAIHLDAAVNTHLERWQTNRLRTTARRKRTQRSLCSAQPLIATPGSSGDLFGLYNMVLRENVAMW
jgi:hypothetical protein